MIRTDYIYRARLIQPCWLMVFLLFFVGCDDTIHDKPTEEPFVRLLENQKFESVLLNGSIEYAVLLPEGYDKSTESYPVVYLLHGYGDDETAWYASGGIKYFVDMYSAEIAPMIYVMPQGFNRYYIDKYNGRFPYMQMFVNELVPTIDERYRTKPDKTQRAVMGYSMGGYGALILPALNPEVFSISVPLSMSFRTDEQYMAESQGSFDVQWAPNFGPYPGASGVDRITDYFKAHSPFHFFDQEDVSKYADLKIMIDCGDDEEILSNTNDNLHALMRDRHVTHEYRVRSGGHSFDYWKKSYPEALKFISNAVQGIEYPSEPVPVTIGSLIGANDYESVEVAGLMLNILKPIDYETSTAAYPIVYFIHQYEAAKRTENITDVFSLLRNAMTASKLPKSIVVEVPVTGVEVDGELMEEIVSQIEAGYRTQSDRNKRVLMGNGIGGSYAANIVSSSADVFGSCFLMCAELTDPIASTDSEVFYYLDITDDCVSYNGYNTLYTQIRNDGIGYEYRVRQGGESYQSFLNGLGESLTSLKESLN